MFGAFKRFIQRYRKEKAEREAKEHRDLKSRWHDDCLEFLDKDFRSNASPELVEKMVDRVFNLISIGVPCDDSE